MTREEAVEIVQDAIRRVQAAGWVVETANTLDHEKGVRCYIVAESGDICVSALGDPLDNPCPRHAD